MGQVDANTTSSASASPQNSPAQVARAPEKRVCIDDQRTGSIFPQKICHKASEWKAINDVQGKDTLGAQIRNGYRNGR